MRPMNSCHCSCSGCCHQTGNWVRNNCRVGVGLSLSPGVDFSCALKGRKRDVNNNKAASLNATCNDMKPNPLASDGGFSYQLVRRVFKDADGSGNRDDADGVLDLAEYAQFSETLEVFFYCLAKNE
ncbi:uncharacterized protein [Littorina saxatilis]|uniref:uncharacterized protein n=1 Tax=Littorina saxatilis TaxID=31220 RepID=UPI0038B66CE1